MINPINPGKKVTLERSLSTDFIVETYKKEFNINVTKYLKGLKKINIYKDEGSGYRFYYPFNITGDTKFYERLQKFEWYYMPWKWEHQIAYQLVKNGDRVLEVGSGPGTFLKKIAPIAKEAIGLELNEQFINKSNKVFNQSIEKYSLTTRGDFDMVCSFQVLEHVPNVHSFLDSSIKCLKKGGKLLISVPNNECLIFTEFGDMTLNLPPHHMGLWTVNSLVSLQKIFGIKLIQIEIEPMQPYHNSFAKKLWAKEFQGKLTGKPKQFGKLVKTFNSFFIDATIKTLSSHMVGHTILAVFEK